IPDRNRLCVPSVNSPSNGPCTAANRVWPTPAVAVPVAVTGPSRVKAPAAADSTTSSRALTESRRIEPASERTATSRLADTDPPTTIDPAPPAPVASSATSRVAVTSPPSESDTPPSLRPVATILTSAAEPSANVEPPTATEPACTSTSPPVSAGPGAPKRVIGAAAASAAPAALPSVPSPSPAVRPWETTTAPEARNTRLPPAAAEVNVRPPVTARRATSPSAVKFPDPVRSPDSTSTAMSRPVPAWTAIRVLSTGPVTARDWPLVRLRAPESKFSKNATVSMALDWVRLAPPTDDALRVPVVIAPAVWLIDPDEVSVTDPPTALRSAARFNGAPAALVVRIREPPAPASTFPTIVRPPGAASAIARPPEPVLAKPPRVEMKLVPVRLVPPTEAPFTDW